jgi:hypothetical protein
MSYDFSTLSPADFEDLVRDLLGRELGVRFEAFAMGPDGGMDGRHASAPKVTVLQAKHFAGSSFSNLKSAMNRERPAIDKLAPDRYLLATSRPLSHNNKADLAKIIGPSLQSEDDIFSPRDLNSLLRKYPDIERAHIKLWLSSATVLDKLLHSAAHSRSQFRTQKDVMKASYAAAQAQVEVTESITGLSGRLQGVGATLERAETKMLRARDKADALDSLAEQGLITDPLD